MYPDCIEEKVKFLLEHPDKSMVYCKTEVVSEYDLDTVTNTFLRRNLANEYIFDDLVFSNDIYYMPIGYMVKSHILLKSLPNRKIYEGRAGQNWQLLLPVAYKNKCGFIKKALGKYVERSDSHSHSESNSTKANIKRLYEYEDVLKNSLPTIMTDFENKQYRKRIEALFSIKIFNLAYFDGDSKTVKKEYQRLKSLGKADNGIKRAYLELNSKALFYLYLLFKNPIELIYMIKMRLFNT